MSDEDGDPIEELLEGLVDGGAPLWFTLLVLLGALGFFAWRHGLPPP